MLSAPAGTFSLAYDQVGTLTGVVAEDGTVVKRVVRDSFGVLVSDSNPALRAWLGFAGGLEDADTGLVLFGARDYDPELGRWTSRDPIDFGGGDSNPYAYCGRDPVGRVDPSGLITVGFGGQAEIGIVVPFTFSAFLVFDNHGNVRLLGSGGGGLGATAAIGGAVQVTEAETVDDLLGSTLDISGNVGRWSIDILRGLKDACRETGYFPSWNNTYWGGQLGWGAGVGGAAFVPRTIDLGAWIRDKFDG